MLEMSADDLADTESVNLFLEPDVKPCCPKECILPIDSMKLVCSCRNTHNNVPVYRYVFLEMDKKEQDLVLMSQLQVYQRSKILAPHYAKLQSRNASQYVSEGVMVHESIEYTFLGLPICQKMYFFIHPIGRG